MQIVPNSAIASPGSYLLIQEAERVEANYSMRAGPLPRAVSPVVTRGPPSKRPRFNGDDLQTSTSASPGTLVTPPSKSKPRPSIPLPDLSESVDPPTPTRSPKSRALDPPELDNSFMVDASPPFQSPALRAIEKSTFFRPKTEENEQRSAGPSPAFPPDRSRTPEPETLGPADSLDFRLRIRPREKNRKNLENISRTVVGQMTSLLANSRSLPRDPELPGFVCFIHLLSICVFK